MEGYVERVCAEIGGLRGLVAGMGAKLAGVELPGRMDSVYFGGGTPSLLGAEQMRRLFAALREEFAVTADAEVTLECAPGQLGEETLDEMLRQGMNRVSFGVQSFVDAEAKAVGRLHTREMCLGEIERMRAAGVGNINVDLIAGLPRQTPESWKESVEVALESGVPHVSVYMLEVDEDSRLGREMLASGARYGAGEVASEDEIAEWYGAGCEWLEAGGVKQYEISNFAREGPRSLSGWLGKDNHGDSDSSHPSEQSSPGTPASSQNDASKRAKKEYRSRHNMKYWRREPYVGFGLDAHSMLRSGAGGVRWANGDDLSRYEVQGSRFEGKTALVQLRDEPEVELVGTERAFEEAMFLGLRMNEGMELEALRAEFGEELMGGAVEALGDVEEAGLVIVEGGRVKLTASGRMASNEVFSRLLVGAAV
jgi:oxygen-independent coproporphyrinogen-3 oxidase